MNLSRKTTQENNKTLSDCIIQATDRGFEEKFTVTSLGMTTTNSNYIYSPEETRLVNCVSISSVNDEPYCNFYLVETLDGKKGYLISFDESSSAERVTRFLNEVRVLNRTFMLNSAHPFLVWLRRFFQIATGNQKS